MYELQIIKLNELLTGKTANLEDIENIIDLENLLFSISFSIQLVESYDEISNFNACLSIMFEIPADSYAALKRAVIEIIHIISEFMKDLDDEIVNNFMKYVVEGFQTQAVFEAASQCFERMLLKNMGKFASSLPQFLDSIEDFSKYITSYNPVWGKCFTSILTLAITVLGNSPDEFKNAFEK